MRFLLSVAGLLLVPTISFAQQEPPVLDAFVRAKVLDVSSEVHSEDFGGMQQSTQELRLTILDGEDAGETVEIENSIFDNREDMRIQKDETLILQRVTKPNGDVRYSVHEKYRLPSLFLLTLIFFFLGVLLGGRIGFTSMAGLAASIAILMFFLVPQILKGGNPLFISVVGSIGIACTSLYLAHGFNRRTSTALASTVITLLLSTILSVIFVHLGKLFGMGSEESAFLQSGMIENVNIRGLLLGGIIIGALGVLDDITTGQTAAVDELSKANHKLGFKELYAAGTSIGREHIASLINSLALAYVGASLPLLLLFSMGNDVPWWVILNSEFIAEEIVRTLVGSSTLLLGVPISTYIAAKAFANGNHTQATGHCCVH